VGEAVVLIVGHDDDDVRRRSQCRRGQQENAGEKGGAQHGVSDQSCGTQAY
jgi:hypothetical protein